MSRRFESLHALQDKPRRRPLVAVALIVAAAFAVAAAFQLVGNDRPAAGAVVQQAADSFSRINRGVFTLRVGAAPRGNTDAVAASVQLGGPFELKAGKRLPLAEIAYTVKSGGKDSTVKLLTDGDSAFTVIQGQAYHVPESVERGLVKSTAELRKRPDGQAATGLAGLKLDFNQWLNKPVVSDGGKVNGTKTWKVESSVDVVLALGDLLAAAGKVGSATNTNLPTKLTDKQRRELEQSIERAYVELYVGQDDKLLRKLDLTIDIKVPEGQRVAVGGASGGRLNLVVQIDSPNQPVNIKTPINPKPASALKK